MKTIEDADAEDDEPDDTSKRNRKLPSRFEDNAAAASDGKITASVKNTKVSCIHYNLCDFTDLVTGKSHPLLSLSLPWNFQPLMSFIVLTISS